jgi:hypothetical protein
MKTDWQTYSPFQSPEVRDICRNMTGAERSEVSRLGALYGVWVGLTFGAPLGLAFGYRSEPFVAIAAAMVTVHLAWLPLWQRRQRRFLCSTAWARERGFTPGRLRLFSFRTGRNA